MVFQSFFMLDVSLAVSTNSMIADLAAPPFQDESASVSAAAVVAVTNKTIRTMTTRVAFRIGFPLYVA